MEAPVVVVLVVIRGLVRLGTILRVTLFKRNLQNILVFRGSHSPLRCLVPLVRLARSLPYLLCRRTWHHFESLTQSISFSPISFAAIDVWLSTSTFANWTSTYYILWRQKNFLFIIIHFIITWLIPICIPAASFDRSLRSLLSCPIASVTLLLFLFRLDCRGIFITWLCLYVI